MEEKNNEVKIIFDCFYGDKLHDHFMHCSDVFEKGKVLADYNPLKMTIKYEEDAEMLRSESIEILKYYQSVIVESSLKDVKINLVFLSVRSVNDVKVYGVKPYIKEGIQSISTGKKWGLFKDMLENLDYDVECDDTMHVIAAKLK